ncbi:MAG: hypothetical protein PHN55_04775 [Dysgonamonadaceae bacterium]|nr:hypothetical protein [Dysgonamonadaceae bacterium]
MKKHLLFLSLLIMLTCSANAQLNLNRLGNKVKEQVEKKKDQVETETQAEQAAEPSNAKQEEDERGKYNYKKTYKPSAKALAADPKASDQTVEAMYTKSISEIHAAYEQFDPELFPYQPYYNYKQFYYLHDDKEEEIRTGQYTSIVMNIAKLPAGDFYYMPYTPIQTPDGEALVTYDEFFRNAWTALFIADPLSPWTFHKYVNVLMFENRMFEIKYTYKMSDAEKGIVNAETGALLFAPSEAAYTHAQDSRKLLALSLARNEVTIDYLRYYLNELFQQCNAETNPVLKYILYWKIDAIMVNVFTKHKDYDASNVANRKVEASYGALESQRFDIETNARMHSAETVEIPKGVQVDSNTSSKINAMAQKQFGDEFVKTIFLSSNWSEFKEDKYPYRVMHLSIPIAVIVKRGGKYLMNYYDVTRSPSGGNWHMMVKMGSSFAPIKYE